MGTVEARSGAVNENLATGEIEIRVKELRILSESETPPFPIEENSKTKRGITSEIPRVGFEKTGFTEKPDDEK